MKSGERDAIFLVDVASGDEEKLQFELDGIFLSPGRRSVQTSLVGK